MVYSFRRVGTETRINSTVEGGQVGYLTQLSDGRYISTWNTYRDQIFGTSNGIFRQLYDANLNRIGGETNVKLAADLEEIGSSTIALSGGRWATLFLSSAGTPSNTTLSMQVFDTNGRVTSEVQVANSLSQFSVRVQDLPGGGFVALWRGSSEDYDGIFIQRFDSNANKIGTQTRVNTSTEGTQEYNRIVELPGGTFGVIWTGQRTQPGHQDQSGIYLQRFDANWNAIGSETLVNASIEGRSEFLYDFVNLSDGGWVATYQTGQGVARKVWQQAFYADGTKRGAEIEVSISGDVGTSPSPRAYDLAGGK